MIKLIRIHLNYLNNKKNNLIIFIILTLSIFIYSIYSKISYPNDELLFFRDSYYESYVFQSHTYLKMIVVILIMFVVMSNFVINQYDNFLYTRESSVKVFLTKLFVSYSTVFIINVVLYLQFYMFLLISPYYFDNMVILQDLIGLILFTLYYFILYLFFYIAIRNVYILIVPFIGYLITSMSLDYGVTLKEISTFSKLLQVLFPDYLYTNDYSGYLYGNWSILGLSCLYLMLILQLFKRKDL